jgi:hypothetical protein
MKVCPGGWVRQYCSQLALLGLGGGVEPRVWSRGLGLAHCWVLRDQGLLLVGLSVDGLGGGGCLVARFLPLSWGRLGGGSGGLVGLLFEIWIVDASI